MSITHTGHSGVDLDEAARQLAQAAHDAYREFRQRQHRLRLAGEKYARVPPVEVSTHARAVLDLWQSVFGAS